MAAICAAGRSVPARPRLVAAVCLVILPVRPSGKVGHRLQDDGHLVSAESVPVGSSGAGLEPIC